MEFIKPSIRIATGLVLAGIIAGASGSGSAVAGSLSKNNAIPQKDPLSVQPVLVPNSAALPGSGGEVAGGGQQAPQLGVERPAPERPIPLAPLAAAGAAKTRTTNRGRTSGINE